MLEVPAAGLEPALSRVTAARLTDSTTPEQRKQQDSNLRGGEPPYAVAKRCLSPRPCFQRKERESNPQGPLEPTRFRDGVPRLWQSFPSGSGRPRTCNLPIKSRLLCRLELRSHDVNCASRMTEAHFLLGFLARR